MKNLSTWLLIMFMFMFWVFRIIVAFTTQYGKNFGGFIAFDFTTEVILLFVAILSFILIIRRKVLGGLIYLVAYGYYFGGYVLTTAVPAFTEGTMGIGIAQNAIVSIVGIVLAICVIFDLLIDRAKKRTPKDKKTDWFFKNDQFDRKYDSRADKNQYRNY